MVGQPSHVKQLSLNHVCKIGLNRWTQDNRARISKRLRSPGTDFKELIPPAHVAWWVVYDKQGYRTGPPGYIGWWNRYLGIDSRAS
jgi:hypothetical protein